jgi:hypothetical protein
MAAVSQPRAGRRNRVPMSRRARACRRADPDRKLDLHVDLTTSTAENDHKLKNDLPTADPDLKLKVDLPTPTSRSTSRSTFCPPIQASVLPTWNGLDG